MKTFFILLFVSITLILPVSQVHAKESKEIRKQRQVAQKERQAEKTDRNREIAEARKSFGEFTRSLDPEYKTLLKEVDIEFELTQVDLQAERAAKIAEAEAEYQKKWTSVFMRSGVGASWSLKGLLSRVPGTTRRCALFYGGGFQ